MRSVLLNLVGVVSILEVASCCGSTKSIHICANAITDLHSSKVWPAISI